MIPNLKGPFIYPNYIPVSQNKCPILLQTTIKIHQNETFNYNVILIAYANGKYKYTNEPFLLHK